MARALVSTSIAVAQPQQWLASPGNLKSVALAGKIAAIGLLVVAASSRLMERAFRK